MTNAEIREVIEAEFPAGTPLADVQARLPELGGGDLRVLERPSGPVLTSWLWGRGGAWASDPYFRWVEVDFWFDPEERLLGHDLVRRNRRSEMLFYTVDPRRNPVVRDREPAAEPPPPGPPPPPAPPPQG